MCHCVPAIFVALSIDKEERRACGQHAPPVFRSRFPRFQVGNGNDLDRLRQLLMRREPFREDSKRSLDCARMRRDFPIGRREGWRVLARRNVKSKREKGRECDGWKSGRRRRFFSPFFFLFPTPRVSTGSKGSIAPRAGFPRSKNVRRELSGNFSLVQVTSFVPRERTVSTHGIRLGYRADSATLRASGVGGIS